MKKNVLRKYLDTRKAKEIVVYHLDKVDVDIIKLEEKPKRTRKPKGDK
jgi:hypothetical protein